MAGIMDFLREVDGSKDKILALESDNEALKTVNVELEQKVKQMTLELEELCLLRRDLEVGLNEQVRINNVLDLRNETLNDWNRELEQQLKDGMENGRVVMSLNGKYDENLFEKLARTVEYWKNGCYDIEIKGATDETDETEVGLVDLLETMKVDELEIEVRTYNCLRWAGIDTVKELLSWKASDVLKIRNLGRHALNDLVMALAEIGLQLAPEDDVADRKKMERILMPSRLRLTTIEQLDLSAETYNALKKVGVKTLGDFSDYCIDMNTIVDGPGVAEIYENMTRLNLTF